MTAVNTPISQVKVQFCIKTIRSDISSINSRLYTVVFLSFKSILHILEKTSVSYVRIEIKVNEHNCYRLIEKSPNELKTPFTLGILSVVHHTQWLHRTEFK